MADKLTVEELAPFNTYLANYCAAYSSFDMQRVEQLFSDNAVQCIGTGIDEFITDREQLFKGLERDFSELASVRLVPDNLSGLRSGNVVALSFSMAVSYKPKNDSHSMMQMPPLRVTLMLEQQQGQWRIVQGHYSAPLSSQPEGESFPKN